MASLDTTALTPVLKTKYTEKEVKKLCYPKNPFHAMVRKNQSAGGDAIPVAMRIGTTQGRSATFATGQSYVTASTYKRFSVTRVSDYAFAEITGEAIEAAKGDADALLNSLEWEIEGALHTATRSLAQAEFRNGGGARGRISSGSTVSSATITLATPADVTNFEPGMKIQASSADGTSGSLRNSGAVTTILSVDRDAGTLTTSEAAWNTTITALAASDYLFAAGDSGALLKGIAAWIPTTAPGATSFFGVDRSVDVTRLGGVRYVGTGQTIEESLIQGAARVAREGGMTDSCFMNPLDYSNLVASLGSKVVYDRATSIDVPEIGFDAVKLMGPMGPIKIIADLNCPRGYAYMLQMDTWCLHSLGPAPRILDFDGNMILRKSTSDSYEIRVGFYGNLSCSAPGWNCVVTL